MIDVCCYFLQNKIRELENKLREERHVRKVLQERSAGVSVSHGNIYGLVQEWHNFIANALGAVSIRKTVLPGMAIPMLKIRRPNGRLIFNMEIAIRR